MVGRQADDDAGAGEGANIRRDHPQECQASFAATIPSRVICLVCDDSAASEPRARLA